MKNVMAAAVLALTSFGSLASTKVVGNYMSPFELSDATCKIRIGKKGTCSGTLVDNDVLITARHCIPQKVEDLEVTCYSGITPQKSKVTRVVQTNLYEDSAVMKLKTPIIGIKPMSIISERSLKLFKKYSSVYKCAVMGFGISNNGKSGVKHGVYLDDVKTSKENFHGTIYNMLRMELKKPYYVNFLLKDAGIDNLSIMPLIKRQAQGEVVKAEEFDKLVKQSPKDFKEFKRILNMHFKSHVGNVIQAYDKKVMNYNIVSRAYSQRKTTSGHMPGDSGGTFACKGPKDEWVLVGVISMVSQKMMKLPSVTGVGFTEALVNTHGLSIPLDGQTRQILIDAINDFGGKYKTQRLHLKKLK